MNFRLILAVVFLAAGPAERAVGQPGKEAVLAAGEAVFDAMRRKDTTALRLLMHPMATLVSTVEDGDSVAVRGTNLEQFLAQIAGSPATLIERMWNAEVRISGAVASIWTQYDFHVGAEWSHCGVDSFQLVRGGQGWRVTSINYTVVRPKSRCKAHPMGPPR